MVWNMFVCLIALGGAFFARQDVLRRGGAVNSDADAARRSGSPTRQDFALGTTTSAGSSLPSTGGSAEVIKTGRLQKLGGKDKDKWQPREVKLTGIEITWGHGDGLRTAEVGSVAPWSALEMPEGFGFEVASRVKGGKVTYAHVAVRVPTQATANFLLNSIVCGPQVYKFVAATEIEQVAWIEAIGKFIGDEGAATAVVDSATAADLANVRLDGSTGVDVAWGTAPSVEPVPPPELAPTNERPPTDI